MNQTRQLGRAVYWANHGRGDRYISDLQAAGFEITRGRDMHDPHEPLEYWCWWDGELRGIIHEFVGEAFLFAWTPEARCPAWRRLVWRITHPLTPLKRFPTAADRRALVEGVQPMTPTPSRRERRMTDGERESEVEEQDRVEQEGQAREEREAR